MTTLIQVIHLIEANCSTDVNYTITILSSYEVSLKNTILSFFLNYHFSEGRQSFRQRKFLRNEIPGRLAVPVSHSANAFVEF
jgi:hypothetical protein